MNRFMVLTLISGSLFALLHTISELRHWYFYYPDLDILMHTWGGVQLVWTLLIGGKVLPSTLQTKSRQRLVILLIVLALVLWEVFGIYRFGGFKPNYLVDTSLDLGFGILGCTLGYIFYRRFNIHYA